MNEPLSEREVEILRLANEGLSNGEIAARLSLSLHTIKWYSRQIYEKLAVENRVQAIQRVQTLGLLNGNRQPAAPVQPSSHLPSPLTTLVGRRSEIDAVKQLLKQHRLVTLTGPGGIGKTRLALRVAGELSGFFKDGVYFVDLAAVNEAALVINTIAHMLGVVESLDTPLLTLTQAGLRHKQLLLVLDNFEHLLDAASVVADLLATTPEVRVLITSREVLALYGEQEYAVPPLQLPDLEWFATHHLPFAELLRSEALQLFERCAQAVLPTFRLTAENVSAVASICLRLDGLPLAIELAAAYSKLLTPQAMLTQLDSLWLEMKRPLRNVPTRQQTLRNTIEWSYRFLSATEKQLFAQLSLFRGGCSWDAITVICTPQTSQNATLALLESLNSLVNKSLVWQRTGGNGEARFGMLETIREFALDCLQESGQAVQTHRRHTLHYLEVAEQARPNLRRAEQVQWLARLGEEHDNLRIALRWALDNGEAEVAARMCWSLWTFWWLRNHLSEGRRWSEQVLVHQGQLALPLRIRAVIAAEAIYLAQGDLVACEQYTRELQELSQQAGGDTLAEAFIHGGLGLIALVRGDWSQALHHLLRSIPLYEAADEAGLAAQMPIFIGTVHMLGGDYEQALPHFEVGLVQAQRVGDRQAITTALFNLGQVALARNELAVAQRRFAEGLPYVQELEDRAHVANYLEGLAAVAGTAGDHAQAAQLFGAAESLFERTGIRGNIFYQPYHARHTAIRTMVEQALGSASYTTLWRSGAAMTLAEMIALGVS